MQGFTQPENLELSCVKAGRVGLLRRGRKISGAGVSWAQDHKSGKGRRAMLGGEKITGLALRAAAISLAAIIFAMAPPRGAFAAQQPAASPKVNELLTSLAREWLGEQGEAKSAAPPAQQMGNSFE